MVSYTAFSPLPHTLGVRRFVFCDTVRHDELWLAMPPLSRGDLLQPRPDFPPADGSTPPTGDCLARRLEYLTGPVACRAWSSSKLKSRPITNRRWQVKPAPPHQTPQPMNPGGFPVREQPARDPPTARRGHTHSRRTSPPSGCATIPPAP